jgi:pyruvate dehydrogenase E1 component alpha subunit
LEPAAELLFFSSDPEQAARELGDNRLLEALNQMLLIRQFEVRAESAYQMGKIGGFFHAYIGQEAVQTAAMQALGPDHWWSTSYRCHALALLLGATPNEIMAELYGKSTGNARGRGGSMHLYTDRLLGGFGIVGGQIPIATGAAFSLKYLKQAGVAICFLGDGAVAQGAFHESLNLAALWKLPAIYVIENNGWGMGTKVNTAISVQRLAESKAASFGMPGYTLDGMDFFNCYQGFRHIHEQVKQTSMPVLVEVMTDRFRGHSISDPGLYRSKQELQACMKRDPILLFKQALIQRGILSEESFKALEKEKAQIAIQAMHYAEESPWPDPVTLGDDVFAP